MLVRTSVCQCWVLEWAAGVSGLVDVARLAVLTIIVAGLLGGLFSLVLSLPPRLACAR